MNRNRSSTNRSRSSEVEYNARAKSYPNKMTRSVASTIRNKRNQCALVFTFILAYYFGVFAMILQSSIDSFAYPLDEPVADYVEYWMDNKSPIRDPINHYNYSLVHSPSRKCELESDMSLRLVYLVKSSVPHFDRREGIRKSWGFERRFSDVEIRTVFVLGTTENEGTQRLVEEESAKYGDIIQANFKDAYYNNTIKTMMAVTWAVKFCSQSKFYLISDDDMYVSTKNVLRFVRNPLNYPLYLEEHFKMWRRNKTKQSSANVSKIGRQLKQIVDIDIADDAELYAGYVFRSSRPHRHQPSKWYIPLSEYPYNYFPPYVSGSSVVLTNVVLKKLYYASFYTKHFRFDDIFLAILAKKLNLAPLHNDEFYFDKKPYSVLDYSYVIASHGYSDPEEMQRIWHQQRSAGNA